MKNNFIFSIGLVALTTTTALATSQEGFEVRNNSELGSSAFQAKQAEALEKFNAAREENILRQATELYEQANPDFSNVSEDVLLKYSEMVYARDMERHAQQPQMVEVTEQEEEINQIPASEADQYERIRMENIQRQVQALLDQGDNPNLDGISEAVMFEYIRQLSESDSVVSVSTVETNPEAENRTLRRYNLHPRDQLNGDDRDELLEQTRQQAELENLLRRQREKIEDAEKEDNL